MLADRLKNVRKQKKLSQEALAKLINTTKGTISNYENKHSTPSNDMLIKLASALDVSISYLLGETNNAILLDKETELSIIQKKIIEKILSMNDPNEQEFIYQMIERVTKEK